MQNKKKLFKGFSFNGVLNIDAYFICYNFIVGGVTNKTGS